MRELARARGHEQDTTEKNGARQTSESFKPVLIVKGGVHGLLEAFASVDGEGKGWTSWTKEGRHSMTEKGI